MATSLVGREDLDRSASPPGRESREDWWSGEAGRNKNGRLGDRLGQRKEHSRSRSRSPSRSGAKGRGAYSPNREMRYTREGTNTTSHEPHLERARLFVGNIEPTTHRRDLIKLFSQYGDVLGVSVHKGYSFVQMDRERSANKAINGEDNQVFMGSKMHVEFSQAALKAGAKFEELSRSPPPLARERDFRPPIYREREPRLHIPDYYHLDDQERHREERLARILQMEREISILRSQQEGGYTRKNDMHRDPPPSINSHGYDSYSRDRDLPYRGDRDRGGGISSGRGYYNRPSPPEPSRGSSGDGYRDAISYPSLNSGGSGSGFSRSTATVGYGSTGGGSGKSSVAPPGWPSGGQDKSNANRPPFSNSGPWS